MRSRPQGFPPSTGAAIIPGPETFSVGIYGWFDRLFNDGVIETYLLWKTASRMAAESGALGGLGPCSFGARSVGRHPRHFDYNVEIAFQTGHPVSDRIRAWAGP